MSGVQESQVAYGQLWQALAAELPQRIAGPQTAEVREANLHALLQRYAWAVPAPGADDVSLYDFARTSAAIAVCLSGAEAQSERPALLVGADLSGVQDWLYTLSSDGAAKSLRGRSVYLQLLMEVIAQDLLAELGLPLANLLYVGGGNFYLLAPAGMEDAITRYRRTAGERLLEMHEGALSLALDATPLETAALANGAVGGAWAQVSDRLAWQKARRFADLPPEDMARAIGLPLAGSGLPESVCRVCQRTISAAEWEETKLVAANAEEHERKCALCVSFDELGGMLSSADFLVVARVKATSGEETYHWQSLLHRFGADVQLLKDAAKKGKPWQRPATSLAHIYYWRDGPHSAAFPGRLDGVAAVWAFRPLAQAVPLNSEEQREKTATFSDLRSEGIERWGVLRMDVDRLSEIFRKGIAPASLARAVSLSGWMRLFFEGYVPQLAEHYNTDEETNPDRQPRIHLMYAGGDDLFIVGGWSWLPSLAAEIQQAFARFVCGNPNVTISGGISIALAEKYPLYQAAQDAGEAEHQSKNYGILADGDPENDEPEKNALTFLGETMTWKKGNTDDPIYDSYAWVSGRVAEMRTWLEGPDASLPRSFLMTLRAIDGEWREWKKREKGEKTRQGVKPRYKHKDAKLYLGPWQWHLVYGLRRLVSKESQRDIRLPLSTLQRNILEGGISSVGLIARWSEFMTRGKTS